MPTRKRRKNKKGNNKDSILRTVAERIIASLLIAIISWFIGIVTNKTQTQPIINQLKADNADLSWGIDYFRQ